ncbi:tyrosine-type recombinase/integrase [Pseudomonas kuykendallii]
MRPKTKQNQDVLPPRMIARTRRLKSGDVWIGYYYNGRDAKGKRIEIPLGTDLEAAKIKWAALESKPVEKPAHLMGALFDRYEREIIPTKAPRTQRDNLAELRQLRPVFEMAPIESVTTHQLAQYRDARSAKTRANRELALLSHMMNIAREWGLTTRANPCTGLRKNKEKPRDYYATPEVWAAIYSVAVTELQDAMDLAYLTGQRPSDVLKMRKRDIVGDYLLVGQGKTQKKLRIRLQENGEPTGLGLFLEQLKARHIAEARITAPLICNVDGLRLSYGMLRNRWDDARAKAAEIASKAGDDDLAALIRAFRFSDIRPKAATEIEDLSAASRLLGHTKEQITKTVYRRLGEVVSPTK